MENKDRGIKQNCGCEFARPYVNNQVFTKMYNLKTALSKGTIFPELYLWDSPNYNEWLYANPKNRVRACKKGGKR